MWPRRLLVAGEHLLQRVRHLQHAGVGAVGADDLDAEGHAGVVDAAGDRGGAGQRHGRRVGDGEPAHVGRHLLAVDLLHEQLRMRERRDGRGRADQHVDVLEEGEEALVELGLLHVRAGHVAERVASSPRSVLSMTLRSSRSRDFSSRSRCAATKCTPRSTSNTSCTPLKSGARSCTSLKAGRKVATRAREDRRRCGGRPARSRDRARRRRAACRDRRRPARPGMRWLSLEEKGSRLSSPICARSSRCASAMVRPIGPGDAEGAEARPARSTAGTTPGEGRKPATPQNDGGRAQAAAVVRAGGERHLAERQRDGRAARGARACLGGIEGIAGRAVDAVGGVGAGAELGRVGLGQDDAARLADVGDAEFVLGGHVVLEQQRARGGAQARGRLQVLHADRQPGQQARGPRRGRWPARSPLARLRRAASRPWRRWR